MARPAGRPVTPVVSPFDASTTASEVIRGVDLGGRRAVVTGASSEIGMETARALAKAGAEVMLTPEQHTVDGWELQFATNHPDHFALAVGLHGALAETSGARIVSVSSSGHGNSGIRFDDLFFRHRTYDAGQAYGQSKTADVLLAVEASRRWAADGILANAVMEHALDPATAERSREVSLELVAAARR